MSNRPNTNREIPGVELEADAMGVHIRIDRGEGEPEGLRFLLAEQAHRLAELLHELADSSRQRRIAYARRHPGQLRDEAELLGSEPSE